MVAEQTKRKTPVRPASEEAAAQAADAAARAEAVVDVVTLSTGIALRVKPVPGRILADAARLVPKPAIPKVMNTDRGREELNPDDPGYIAALAEWAQQTSEASFNVALAVGTTVESIPDGMHGPDSDAWVEEVGSSYEVVGMESPIRREPAKARYLDWLLYYALGRDEDNFVLTKVLFSTHMITREELADAINSFRGLAQRRIDPERSGDAGGS